MEMKSGSLAKMFNQKQKYVSEANNVEKGKHW